MFSSISKGIGCANLQAVWPVQSFYYSSSQCWIVSKGAVKQSERKQTLKPGAWNRVHPRNVHRHSACLYILPEKQSLYKCHPHMEENRRFKITYFLEKKPPGVLEAQVSSGVPKTNVFKYLPDIQACQIPMQASAWVRFDASKFGQETFRRPGAENHTNSGERYSSKSKIIANREVYMVSFTRFAASMKFAASKIGFSEPNKGLPCLDRGLLGVRDESGNLDPVSRLTFAFYHQFLLKST